MNASYRADYDALIESGLYKKLADQRLLVSHEELADEPGVSDSAYKILAPNEVPFLSYPYEWCFSQLQDAALLTLECQRLALEHGMVLKDASAYNVQFVDGRPTLIDTLSFERYVEGLPWIAYGQFCRHFLAPLALASYVDIRLLALAGRYIDGVPLDLASRLLPARTRLRLGLVFHLHLHARSQKKYEARHRETTTRIEPGRSVTKHQMLGIIDNLQNTVGGLTWEPAGTQWADYTGTTHYSASDRAEKKRLVTSYLERSESRSVLDLGANTGVYSRVAARLGCRVIACDGDPAAVEKNYLSLRHAEAAARDDVHPLLIDLANPSPALGWASQERPSFARRASADAVMALAIVHHLAIGNNVPLDRIAGFLRELAPVAIVEWVPKEDPRTRQLLASREDVFADYSRDGFEEAFGRFFTLAVRDRLGDTARSLYLFVAGSGG